MEIRPCVLVFLFTVVGVSSVGCSKQEQHPAQIGDCVGSAAACLGNTIGSGSGSSADGGEVEAGTCGLLSFIDATCQTCVETSCCSLVGLCSDNADCLSLVECIGGCQTQSCVDACRAKLPNGVAGLDALDQCLVSSCSAECLSTDAGTIGGGSSDAGSTGQSCGTLVFQSAGCQTCVEDGCCDQAEMCSTDPDCSLYVQCLVTCKPTDTKCVTDCQTLNPLGFSQSTRLQQCIQDKCAAQCQ